MLFIRIEQYIKNNISILAKQFFYYLIISFHSKTMIDSQFYHTANLENNNF
jgi:hypothetical protein